MIVTSSIVEICALGTGNAGGSGVTVAADATTGAEGEERPNRACLGVAPDRGVCCEAVFRFDLGDVDDDDDSSMSPYVPRDHPRCDSAMWRVRGCAVLSVWRRRTDVQIGQETSGEVSL